MLHSIKALKKCAIHAIDGEVGKVRDVYFDDESWVLRYLVIDTGNWLTRHEVLLSPHSVRSTDWAKEQVHMELDRDRIENSPGIDTHQPVSRQSEAALSRHYGVPYYWDGPHASGKQNFSDEQLRTIQSDIDAGSIEDRHLHSCNEVGGYALFAYDDRVGHVADFLFDEDDWSLQYLVVDPRDLWPGKHVLIPASRVEHVYWSERKVVVDMRSEEVKHSQEYDPDHLPPSIARTTQVPIGSGTTRAPGIPGV